MKKIRLVLLTTALLSIYSFPAASNDLAKRIETSCAAVIGELQKKFSQQLRVRNPANVPDAGEEKIPREFEKRETVGEGQRNWGVRQDRGSRAGKPTFRYMKTKQSLRTTKQPGFNEGVYI